MAKQAAKTATPRLRFPDFRNSEGWSTERMDRLYSFGRNNILSRDKLNYVGGTAKNIHYGDIHTKFPAQFDVSREQVPFVNQSEALPEIASDDYCVESDLVFADASEDMNDVGKAMEIVRLHGERVLAGQHTILARQRGGTFVTGFGAYLFGSGLMRGRIKKEAQGTKVYQISAARLGGIDVTYPSLKAEQQKIADCLTSLDEVIAAQGRKVEALKAHKRGLMQQLFPREGETRPRLRFPEFRNAPEWRETSLGALVEFQSGATPSKANPEFWNGTIPWVSAKDMKQMLLEDSEDHISSAAIDAGAKTVPSGALLILTRGMTLLKDVPICVARRDMALNQDVKALRPTDGVESMFLAFLLMASKERLLDMVAIAGHGTGKLDTDGLRSFGLAIPSPEEQQRIADCLASLDTRISAETDYLAALKTHKQGLMQQLFPAPEAASA